MSFFLISPEAFHTVSRAASQFSDLSTLSWGRGDTIIEYGYDANGSLTSKTTTRGAAVVETVVSEYNLQNRLASVTTTKNPDTEPVVTTVEYRYNPSGIRVEKKDTDSAGRIETHYLIDPQNHTGYAQVLEETADRYDASDGFMSADRVQYTLSDDVTGQTKSAWSGSNWQAAPTQYLLYDGHGSTRQLITQDQIVQETYSYDGYGILLQDTSAGLEQNAAVTPEQATSVLYAGEQYDFNTQQYNNRARWYNPLTGLFNRMDPYAGNLHDPQSLHKYLYCHANPVNAIDPGGLFFTAIGQLAVAGIRALMRGISTAYLTAYMWAATNMALITSIAYYSMWTFIVSSLWVGAEQQGYVPKITILGNWTVAKATQVVSGSVFFLGLMIMGSVPNMDRGPLVRQVQTRTYELRQEIGQSGRFGTTMAVGVAEKSGERVTLIATSEGGLYLRPGVTLKSNEILVSGTGHAEQRIVDFCRSQNMRLLTIGATRPICADNCVPAITPTDADIVTPIKGEDVIKR